MESILVREWDNEAFHRRVLELESNGYVARCETYSVTAEQSPETGYVIHVYCVEMRARLPDEISAKFLQHSDNLDSGVADAKHLELATSRRQLRTSLEGF